MGSKLINPTLLLSFALAAFNAVSVSSMRLKNVTIPSFGVLGSMAQLFCDFSLESDKLLVLKWYKDEQEFFRYSPTTDPSIVIFNTTGINVDVWRSSLNVVTLKNLTLETGGTYKCEVSADKTFQTLTKYGQMEIVALPVYEPEIFGVPHSTNFGNFIAGKCTSHRSKPAAELNLYVNADLANSYVTEYITITEPDGLDASVLGFNFTVQPKHVRKGRVNLKCTAVVGDSYLVREQSVSVAGRWRDGRSKTFLARISRFLTGRASGIHGGRHQHKACLWYKLTILIWMIFSSTLY